MPPRKKARLDDNNGDGVPSRVVYSFVNLAKEEHVEAAKQHAGTKLSEVRPSRRIILRAFVRATFLVPERRNFCFSNQNY